MSAYIVEKNHIIYLVAAALSLRIGSRYNGPFRWYHKGAANQADRGKQLGSGDYDRAAEVANMLWRENVKSVSYRYPNESSATLPGPNGENFVIEPRDFCGKFVNDPFDPLQVMKAVACFEYQSCEHPEWEESEAFAFAKSLEGSAIAALPGYDDAAWGAPDGKTKKQRMAA